MPVKKIYPIVLLLFFFCLEITHAQITVDFTVNSSTGCGTLSTQFFDQSTSTAGAIVEWQWSGGVISSQQNPNRAFSQPGTYSVCLQVKDSQGNQASLCKDDLVIVHKLPEPDFTVSSEGGCVPANIVFTDASIPGDAAITNWIWDLNGNCGNIQNTTNEDVSCTYTISDDYSPTLRVVDANGCENTITKQEFVSVTPAPALNNSNLLITDAIGCSTPHTVNFAYDLADTTLALSWEFSNGVTFEGRTPGDIVFEDLGTYSLNLILTNPNSLCADTLDIENVVRVGSEASFEVSATKGCEDETVFRFTDTSPEAAQTITWDFGDPNTEDDVSTAANPTYVYTNTGCFTVTMNRTLANGCSASYTLDTCIQIDLKPIVYPPTSLLDRHCSLPHSVPFSFAEIEGVEIASWEWDFGDGNTSTEHNPAHEYTAYGSYPVTLTVYNEAGCDRVYPVTTVELQELKAIIDNVNASGCTPLEVSLSESSTSIEDVDFWSWEVTSEEGTTYTSGFPSPTLSLVDTGVYDVKLIVRNSLQCVDTVQINDVIEVGMLPTIDFTAEPLETCIEWVVDFEDNSSPFVEEWYWDFSNGQNSNIMNPSTSYLDTGYYDISLVGTHNGCSNSLSKDNYVRVMAPVSKFEVINFCQEPYKRKFQNTSIDANFVEWDFGVPGGTSTEENPEFVYSEVGTYEVILTVYNSETGCSHESSKTVVITDPSANFTVDNTEGCIPFVLPITQLSEDANTYLWSAPGATIANPTAANPTITYNANGTYSDVQLIITDVNSCKDTIVFTEDIFVGQATASFSQSITGGCLPLTVDFEENSTSLYADIVSWEWTFGNNLGTSSVQNPSFTFTEAGLHNVSLTVIDEWGCQVTETIVAAVEVTNPIANFSVDSMSCTWAPLAFNNTSQGVALDYEWDFGDGTTSDEEDPTHLYTTEGEYTVCLTITDKYNCIDTKCMDRTIEIADPIAAFSVDSSFSNCPPLPVNYINESQNSFTYIWDYGDNSGVSLLPNPYHIYNVPGSYDVTLIAYRTEACQDTLVASGLIELEGPTGTYSFDVDTACAPATITFTANSEDPYMYVWDFGTGVFDTTQLSTTSEVITFTYEDPRIYSPSLTLVNNECARTLPSVGDIIVASNEPDFAADRTILCTPGESVNFQNQSSGGAFLNIEAVEWIFEGGTPATSTLGDPTVTYDAPGEYDVTIIVYNGSCYDTLTKVDYIKLGEAPNVGFEASSISGCAPLTVNFRDTSFSTDSNITSWSWDFGDGNTSNLQNPTNIYNGANGSSFSASLTITTSDGCVGTHTEQINLLAVSEVTAGEDVSICLGESTILNGSILGDTTGLEYFWTPAASLSCTSCLNPVASPLDTTTYTLIVRTSEGCTSTSEVTVLVKPYPLPVVETSGDTSICLNSFTQLRVSGGDGVYSYDWSMENEGLSCYDNCLNPIASPTESTTYYVTVTTRFGCAAKDSIRVDVIDERTEFASQDRTICAGDTVHLGISSGFDPYWMVNDYLSCSSCPDPIARPEETVNYKVRVTTNSGCEIIDSVLITTIQKESVSAGLNDTICAGDMVSLSGTGEGLIAWNPAEHLDDPTILDPVASPTATTTYTLTVENGECVLTDSVTIAIKNKVEINTEDVTICEGDSIDLVAVGDALEYEWVNMSDSTTLEITRVAPVETTSYRVIGTNSSCISDTSYLTVTVNPAPRVVLDPAYPFFSGLDVTLVVFPEGADSVNYEYEWTSTADISCISCQNLDIVAPVDSTTYNLKITNRLTGCINNYETTIRQMKTCPSDLIQVPTSFSPNNDGINDVMKVIPHPILPGIQTVKVFNRWGALIYEGYEAGDSWNGKFDGEEVENGVYIYSIEARCPANGAIFQKNGDVTIIR